LSTARVHRIPLHVDDVGQRPSLGQDARLVELICPTGKAEYFCNDVWTGRIALIRFNNLAFRRNSPQAVQTRSPDGAKRNPGRRSHRWINPSPKRKRGEAASQNASHAEWVAQALSPNNEKSPARTPGLIHENAS
jgi:hypothetical protein